MRDAKCYDGCDYDGTDVYDAADDDACDNVFDNANSMLMPAMLVLARQDPEGLAGAARLATVNPARALGLGDRGEIAPGKRADLVIADDEGVGHVRATFRAGRKVFSDGSLRLREVA